MQKKGKKRLTAKQRRARRLSGVILSGVVLAAAVSVILMQGRGGLFPKPQSRADIPVESSEDPQEEETSRTSTHYICLDPGHGGKDPGASGGGYTESEDVLEMSLLIRRHLEKQGCTVLMTREDDTFLSLEERVDMANAAGVEALVAIHRNTTSDPSANGAEVWIHSAAPQNAEVLATHILERIGETATMDVSRGIRLGTADNENVNYWINQASSMASCIVELGFLSSDIDNQYFHNNMDAIAKAVADGILDALEDPEF